MVSENYMSQEKLVSVYINTYNREDLVGETIQSVLRQTYSNLQIIVVDDGSTDRTADVVRSFEDPRIEFYPLEKNLNVVGALNEGLKHVRGDYAAHVDSDDLWDSNKIRKQVEFLENNPEYGSCFSLVKIIDETGTEYDGGPVLNRELFQVENMTQPKMLRYLFDHSNHLNHSSMIVRKEILDRTGGYDPALQYLHDFDLWLRFCLEAPLFIIQEPLVGYRVHSGNYSSPDDGRDNAYQWEFASVIRSMIDHCPGDLFAQAFADKRKCNLPLTPQILEIEKAFVLLDAFTVNSGNPVLGVERLDRLFEKPENRKTLEEVFGFTREELYQLHRQNAFFNAEKTQHLKNLIQIGEDGITNLNAQINTLEDTIADKDLQVKQLSRELTAVKSKKNKLAKALGKLGAVYSKKLKNGAKARKKMMLYGFYGHNLGDDMFFDMLFRRYPDVLFAVCDSSSYTGFFEKYNNVRLYAADSASAIRINLLGEKFGKKNIYEKIVRSSTSGGIHLGGSVYQQIGNWKQDLEDRKSRKQSGKSFFGISNNFGPYHSDDYREFWKEQFRTWNDVCFRDLYSYNLFSEISSVRYAPDALFAFESITAEESLGEQLLQTMTGKKKKLAISVINLRWELRGIQPEICDAYEAFLCRLVEEALEKDFDIYLLSFCELQQDSAMIQRIMDHFKDHDPESVKRIHAEIYYDRIGRMLQTISKCEYVLGTRFHAMVLGYIFGKKVLPVCYSDKMTNVLGDLELTEHYVDIRNLSTYPEHDILDLFSEADSEKIEKIRSQAADQFLRLDQYLS